METIKIRGLVRLSAWIFAVWGGMVFLKGGRDLIWGQPEANLYAPVPWAFVSRPQWVRYAGFESVYGAACAVLAWLLFRYSRFLPETLKRRRREPEFSPFQ